MAGWTVEYRAVFGDPHGGRSYGDFCESVVAAAASAPDRPEETLRSVVGVQTRKVEPWADVPLAQVMKAIVASGEATSDDVAITEVRPRAVRDEPQA